MLRSSHIRVMTCNPPNSKKKKKIHGRKYDCENLAFLIPYK